MRFNNKYMLKTLYAFKRNEVRKILMKTLNLTSINDFDKFINMKKTTITIPSYRIISNCGICQKYNIHIDSLEKFHYCLKLLDYKLEHRINVFKEIGVPIINASLINQTVCLFNEKMSKFKNKTNIPAEQDIAKNIFGGEVPNDVSYLNLNDKLTVLQYYQKCLLYCKTRIFNLPYLDDKVLLHNHNIKSMKSIKSISMIAETLKVLRTDLEYDDKMIKRNPSVIAASADNIRLLLNSFTDIVGIPIVTFLRKYPLILFENVNNIKQLLMLFKQYKIPDKYVKKCVQVFQMNNEVFHERIEIMKRHPDMKIWYKHSRMIQIIYHMNKTKDRLKYVDIMDSTKWANPQAFLSNAAVMDKLIQVGLVSSKHNLKYVLIKELGVDMTDLLMRHQHWKRIAFVDVIQMLKYLKKHFTINEICPNIHIILYKESKVKKVLADLKQQYSHSTEYSFTNSQYLALCLYMLEKDNHFTGDGIWSDEQNMKQQSLKERNIVERSEDNTSTMEDNIDNPSTEHNNDIDHNDI